jgi:fructose-1,6-bisphosphatase/sedoheptulose 1,7-bisphosphatase-like protein
MHSYVDIKAAATKVLNEGGAPEGVRHIAAILVTIADRTARLEERHAREIEELKARLKKHEARECDHRVFSSECNPVRERRDS